MRRRSASSPGEFISCCAGGRATGFGARSRREFSWDYFQDNWETMLRQLYTTGLFFILPFSILGLVLMWRWNWRVALVLTAWIVPDIALYTAYYWAPDGT